MTPVPSHEQLLDRLSRQHIETQSWGYVNTGTRFKVFTTPAAPRDVREKIDDAADPLRAGRLLGLPYHYRDLRTVAATAVVDDVMSPAELYRRNGLDPLPFNSLYQLVADREEGLLAAADAVLFMPDLLGYWLTGRPATEPTIASTSGLLAPGGIGWDTALVRTLGLPVDVLPPMLTPGDPLGPLSPSAAAQTGLDLGVVVRKVASHDTASAVVGTPLEESGSAYLSCGTWSLLGVEVDRPVIGEEARLGRFTHEAGVDGTILLHKNLMGLGLVSGLVGDAGDLVAVLRAAASVHLRPDQLIDPADRRRHAPLVP